MPKKVITVYTKFCIDCVRQEEMKTLVSYCRDKGYDLEVVRTTYRPQLHEEATALWGGDETYTMFVYEDGFSTDFDEYIRKIKEPESWDLKTKTKPAKKTKRK